jgi:hypothetical protein
MKTNGRHEVIARIAGPGLVLAALLAIALSNSSAGRAQSSAASPAAPAAAQAIAAPAAQAGKPAAQAERQRGGNHEGITVHGHWIIEVKNPDGTVTARREFENSIQATGMAYLASLIAGNNSSGGLSVLLNGATASLFPDFSNGNNTSLYFSSTQTGPCLPMTYGSLSDRPYLNSGGSSSGTTCLLTGGVTSGAPAGVAGTVVGLLGAECLFFQETYLDIQTVPATGQTSPCSTNLNVSAPTVESEVPPSSPSAAAIQITGSVMVTSPTAGDVMDVETVFTTCTSSFTPANCLFPFSTTTLNYTANPAAAPVAINFLTERNLDGQNGDPPEVPYSPGQMISVSVTISFQ